MRPDFEFYVGYLPIPVGVKRHVRRAIVALGITVVAGAVILVAGQHPFPNSVFEFQQYRDFEGTLLTRPYLALSIPGQGSPWLLVGPGKHGLSDLSLGLDGTPVRLKGERIFRGNDHMIELLPNSLAAAGTAETGHFPSKDFGPVQLTGEIVDSKCYFGVMNPGNGKVHRDCAVRCISGGVPPAFLVRDGTGQTMTLLLEHWNRELLRHVAEPVTIRGRLARSSGRLTLYAE
jgi:hypothetical protein